MRTLIVGAGRIGRALADDLILAGHDVRLLDPDEDVLARLGPVLEARALHGSPLDRGTLAGAVAGCDGLAAVTGDDALNAVVALAARRELGVPNAVAVIGNAARATALSGLGIDIRCPTTRTAGDVRSALLRSGADEELVLGRHAAVYRLELPARMSGRSLDELAHPGELLPLAVERAGRVLLATSETVIEDGDVLHAAASRPDLVTDLMHP